MNNNQVIRIKTISEFHRFRGMPKPEHPLISVINLETVTHRLGTKPVSLVYDFYSIGLKRNCNAKFRYGQQKFDFDEGVMYFMSPNQVLRIEPGNDEEHQQMGWILLIHPDFFWHTSLTKTIRQYEYFDYAVNEALFLSEKEEETIIGIMQSIQQEYHSNIDKFSQGIIISQIEVLLNYADRFYQRQFITRKIANHQILDRLEEILNAHFNRNELDKGLPTVQYIADELNISPNYLSSVLKVLTGQSTQQHIHDKLIEKAKEQLSTTELTVSEIAYELGFEHSQSFSKLFKRKTQLSPLEFRNSFS